MRHLSLCLLVWFGFEAAVLMLMMLPLSRTQMPIEDRDETICAGISLQAAGSAALCDREPGAVRLAAVEPEEEADGRCCCW